MFVIFIFIFFNDIITGQQKKEHTRKMIKIMITPVCTRAPNEFGILVFRI